MAAKKILMLVGDFVEDYEVMVPFQALAGRPSSLMRSARASRMGDSAHARPRF